MNFVLPKNHEAVGKPLGQGSSSVVILVRNTITSQMSCIKLIQTQSSTHADNIKLEAKIGQKLKHPNLLKTIGYGQFASTVFVQTEYAPGEDLSKLLKKFSFVRDSEVKQILVQILLALFALENAHVLHRDIKPENILVFPLPNQFTVFKLGDFGLSKEQSRTDELAETQLGSPAYMSPELLAGLPYNSKSDLYSVGVLLYRILSGEFPYVASSAAEFKQLVLQGRYPKIVSKNEHELKLICYSLLEVEAARRPKTIDVLGHPALAEALAEVEAWYTDIGDHMALMQLRLVRSHKENAHRFLTE